MKVLIVDDSVVFRTTISTALSNIAEIEVVGTAANGRVALQKLEQQLVPIDLITLDMEMPELNGIETLKALRKKGSKVKVIVFSSQTTKGAEKALEALREGADDVVAKPEGEQFDFENAAKSVRESLLPKILQFTDSRLTLLKKIIPQETKQYFLNESLNISNISKSTGPKQNLNLIRPQAIVIASSTGGPTALELIFSKIKGPLKIPILITQHMPPVFTQILAKRIYEVSGIPCTEAQQNEIIEKNKIYIAPGDYHLEIIQDLDARETKRIFLHQKPLRNSVRPAADFLFESASRVYKRDLLGIVLTGMGEDGAIGSKLIRENHGAILIQNKESCIVFGMPGALFELNEYDDIKDLEQITTVINNLAQGY